MDESREAVHDESHARALLKGWLRRYREQSAKNVLGRNWGDIASSRSSAFRQTVSFMKATIGDGMIFDANLLGRNGKIKTYVAYSLEALELNLSTKEISFVLDVPICVTIVDSKHPNRIPRILKPFLLSEHLLCRVIQRTGCRSLKDLAAFFVPLATLMFEDQMIDRSRAENLILLFGDGYYATIFDEDEGILVIKTWVSVGSWTPMNEAKLSLLAERLSESGLAVLVSERDFERSVLLSPEDYLKHAIRVG